MIFQMKEKFINQFLRWIIIFSIALLFTLLTFPRTYFYGTLHRFVTSYIVWGIISAITSLLIWLSLIHYSETKRQWREQPRRAFPLPIIIGILERSIYTALIGFNISGAAAFIGAWVTIKAVGGWASWSQDRSMYGKILFFSGLIGSGVSVLLGIIGGIIYLRWSSIIQTLNNISG